MSKYIREADISPPMKYIMELNRILETFREIDQEMTWQNTEPEWWLDMMDIKKFVTEKLQKGARRANKLIKIE